MAPLRHLLASLAALLVMATVVVTHAQTPAYDPTKVDWASVVDSCAAAFRFERRLGSFALRASFHDVASVTPQCATNPGPGCGGADGSLMLSADEQLHETNRVELFASNTARVVLPIAKKYGASVADTLHVCALVAPSILAYPASMPQGPKPRVVRMDLSLRSAVNSGFKVGRIDRVNAAGNDPALIPAAGMDLQQTADWFTSRGIPLDQAAALLGVHSLLRPKGCYVEDRIDPRTGAVRGCVPFAPNTPGGKAAIPRDTGPFVLQPGSCPMVAMMRWSNEWFADACGVKGEGAPDITDVPSVSQNLRPGQPGFADQVASAVCGYRQDIFRADAVARHQSGQFLTPPSDRSPTVLNWACSDTGCIANPGTWFYTKQDALLSNACRAGALLAKTPSPAKLRASAADASGADAAIAAVASAQAPGALLAEARAAPPRLAALMKNATLNAATADDVALVKQVRAAFMDFAAGSVGLTTWSIAFGKAYAKMASLGAEWAPTSFVPSLLECPSGWRAINDTAANRATCVKRCADNKFQAYAGDCPDTCRCATAPLETIKTDIVPATGAVTAA